MYSRDDMNWYLGTIGFSYSDWRGVFYPSEIPARKFLAYYSRIFNSVEVNTSFHGVPSTQTLKSWDNATPPGFMFSFKVPQVITHESEFKEAAMLVDEFLDRVSILEMKLGIILFQFPPSFRIERINQLSGLFAKLPPVFRFAIEVRDISWHQNSDPLISLCRKHDVCWVATEYPGLPKKVYPTASFYYIRWIGENGKYRIHDHEREDKSVELNKWNENIIQIIGEKKDIFGFFNNDYTGFAAGAANRFKSILQLPVEDFSQPKQGTLF